MAGFRMTADEATTIEQLAALTGRSRRQLIRLISRSFEARLRFAVAVQLVTGEWQWLDGATGQWRTDEAHRLAKLRHHAECLVGEPPCNGPSPSL